ncbi:MAG: hydantoinase B/oxoprolinase family protein [Hyphomicrobiales bacterium]|nr:hydantoinase B/oxoprolinase family protein [Hyphomicrobiales bacterium]
MSAATKPAVDPITVEIIRNGVLSVTEEMKTNLTRTAYNMIIYEALDFTVGLFTADGETVSIGLGLPMFIRGMSETVKAKLKHFGKAGLEPGDILITNDSYITGSHLNHITLSLPIFHNGELIAFTCCMAHWLDVGGSIGQVTTDIYSEGLQVPILKLHRAGVLNQDLVDIISMNVRLPDTAIGDLRAQITAVTSGERAFRKLVERYGRDAVLGSIYAIMDQTEAEARANTRSIPDGVYEAESFMDDDGLDIGKHIPIKVKVEVRGDEMTIDLSDVSPQVRGFYNSGITTGYACAQVAYKCLTTGTTYPVNDGSFRSLNVIMPPGRVISATRPAPMRWWMTFPMTVVDTIFKALASAIPDRVIAGHHADLVTITLHGLNPIDGRFFIAGLGPLGGGWGAKSSEDGIGVTVCINDGDTHNSPTEQLETKYPILIEKYALRDDSGGPGRFRGGVGAECVVQALSPIHFNSTIERMHCKPWGLHGGKEADGNFVNMRVDGAWQETPRNAKVMTARLKPGDAFMVRTGGGGGFGPPTQRPPKDVLFDVIEGYVSREAAERDYGVILDASGTRVDETATAARRSRRAAE